MGTPVHDDGSEEAELQALPEPSLGSSPEPLDGVALEASEPPAQDEQAIASVVAMPAPRGPSRHPAMPRASVMPSAPTGAQAAAARDERWVPDPSPRPLPPQDTQSPPTAPLPANEDTEEAPPTAPEAAGIHERRMRRPAQPEPSLQELLRLPQGLGGPNIAAPTALERLRARHAAPPGVHAVVAVPRLPRLPQFEGDVAVMALRHRLSLQPEIVLAPPMRRRSTSSIMPSLGRFSLVMLVASSVALTVVLFTLPETRPAIFKSANNPVTIGTPRVASAPAVPRPSPRLIGVDARRTFTNEALALGITLNGASGSELALLSGLVSGTRLSVGNPIGANGWKLAARDLASALAYAPKDFVGVMNAAIDLRLSDDQLVDSRVMRLEWVRRPEPQAQARPPKREEPRPPVAARPAVDEPEIVALVKRGQDYLQSGDIVSARLMLRRAASGGSAQAALMLGASYDPIVLRDLGVLGFSPDPEQAKVWYQRAAEYGSSEATRRLDRLATVAR